MKQNMRKALAFSFLLTFGLLTAQAQDGGGLFGKGPGSRDMDYGTRDGLIGINDNTGGANGGITNDPFGAPLGSGIAILIGAGLGYVALKKKEDEQ